MFRAWHQVDGRSKEFSRLVQRAVAFACLAGIGSALSASPSLGWALFVGRVPLAGRVSSHPTALPPEVVRCSNCHSVDDGPEMPGTQAPRLTRAWLTELQPRRGGPPSNYSLQAFCTLLRTGADPAYVVISEQMPRYAVTDHQCTALWRYVTTAHESRG